MSSGVRPSLAAQLLSAFGMALVLVFASGDGAAADDFDDCNSADPTKRVTGCQALIDLGRYEGKTLGIIYNRLGTGLLDTGRAKDAVPAFSAAIKNDPKNALYYHNRGRAHRDLEETDKAIADLSRAVSTDKGRYQAYRDRGLIYVTLGKQREARADLVVATTAGCAARDTDFIRRLQEQLTKDGFWRGATDGVCRLDDKLEETVATWAEAGATAFAEQADAAQASGTADATADATDTSVADTPPKPTPPTPPAPTGHQIAQHFTSVEFRDSLQHVYDEWEQETRPLEPFDRPERIMFEIAGGEDRRAGLFGRARAIMDSGRTRNGVEFLIFENAAQVATDWQAHANTPESGDGAETKHYDVDVETKGETVPVHCRHMAAKGRDGPTELRCARHRAGTQFVVVAYSYGTDIADKAARDKLAEDTLSAAVIGDIAVLVAMDALGIAPGDAQGITPAAAPDVPAAAPDVVAALLGQDYLAKLQAQYEDAVDGFAAKGEKTDPFAPPRAGIVIEPTADEREQGMQARIRYPMNVSGRQAALEMLVYGSAAEAADHIESSRTWPKSVLPADPVLRLQTFSFTIERTGEVIKAACTSVLNGEIDGKLPTRCYMVPRDYRIIPSVHYLATRATGGSEVDVTEENIATFIAYAVRMAEDDLKSPGTAAQPTAQPSVDREPAAPEVAEPAPETAPSQPVEAASVTRSPVLPDDLLHPAFHAALRARFAELISVEAGAGRSMHPFVKPSEPTSVNLSDDETEAGVVAKIRFPTTSKGQASSLDLLVFDTVQSAERVVGGEGPMIDILIRQNDVAATRSTTASVLGGQDWPVTCVNVFRAGGGKPDAICILKKTGSRIIAAARYQFAKEQDTTSGATLHDQIVHDHQVAALFVATFAAEAEDMLHAIQAEIAATEVQPSEPAPVAADAPLDPKLLADALADPAFMAALADRLALEDAIEEPYRAPTFQDFLDPVAEEEDAGIHGIVTIDMSGDSGESGLFLPIYRTAADAAADLEQILVTDESFDDAGGYTMATSEITAQLGADAPLFRARCARAGEKNLSAAPTQIHCVHYAAGSQVTVSTYHYSDRPLDRLTRQRVELASAPVLAVLDRLVQDYQADLRADGRIDTEPSGPPAPAEVLAGAPFLQAFQAALDDRKAEFARSGNALAPFGDVRDADSVEPTERERQAGLIARVRVPMADPSRHIGTDFLVYDAADAAARHVAESGSWPDGDLPLGAELRTLKFALEGADGGTTVVECRAYIDMAGTDRRLDLRCPVISEDGRVVASAYYSPVMTNAGATITRMEQIAAAWVAFDGIAVADRLVASPTTTVADLHECEVIHGKWSWFSGGFVSFLPGGGAHWSHNSSVTGDRMGEWSCDPASDDYTISWQNGFVDSVALSPDGQGLSGENQNGVAVTGNRFDPDLAAQREHAKASQAIADILVGTWALEIMLPTQNGPVQAIWTIGDDGTYSVDAGILSHAGTMEANNGKWSLKSDTNGYTDSGTYETEGWAAVLITGKLGPGRWHRRAPALALELAEMQQDLVPAALPELARAARKVVRGWQADAELVGLELDHHDTAKRKVGVKLTFYAPGSGGGLWVTVTPDGSRFHETRAANWGDRVIPDGFLDLPQAWATARQQGQPAPLGRARLHIENPDSGEPVLVWSLSSLRGATGTTVDAVYGQVLTGSGGGAAWNKAAEGYRQLSER